MSRAENSTKLVEPRLHDAPSFLLKRILLDTLVVGGQIDLMLARSPLKLHDMVGLPLVFQLDGFEWVIDLDSNP